MGALIGSKGIATAITWLVLLLFIALVSTGWWYLLLPSIRIWQVVALASLTLTFLAVLAARQIGQYRADAFEREERRPWYFGWKPYLFLAIISALGTLNAAFVIFESRAILRDDIRAVRSAYSTLRDRAHEDLQPRGYAEKQAQLDGLLRSLHEEIVNPNPDYCGVGGSARAIIADIARLIPGYRVLNGSVPIRPCIRSRAEQMYQSYESMAREMIRGDEAFLRANGPAKLEFLALLDSHYAAAARDLTALETSVSGFGTTDFIEKRPLYEAKNNYNADRSTFFSLRGSPVPEIREIARLQSDEVNSYASTLRLFWDRLFNLRTLFYLAIALAIDFLLIQLLTLLNVKHGKKRRPRESPTPEMLRFQTDPKYLWVNPT